ncbi:MAG: helix-turn-helix transcriptional regulator [Bacteroidota bacterium]
MNDDLTTREQEVLELIADGLTDDDIAKKLGISIHTVNTHRKKILSKLDANNVASMIRKAMRKGLIK